ncbi:hypothetical protein DdX_19339 [Ditylenchus destructor]|uniref:SprT-like domain-containing protein n=1 Tax=Ditylenchus destructor TaxID=166010 RepID=A0AAD4QSD4_9BILA|nr:hypothetical protein DdX_19339 [Ditylenchus destructor]
MPKITKPLRYSRKDRQQNHKNLACVNKFKALDLDASTTAMDAADLRDLARDWWNVIGQRLYANNLPIPEIIVEDAIIEPDGTVLFGCTDIPGEKDEDQTIVVHLSMKVCSNMRLFVGTIMHEACHVAAAYLFGEEDQTQCPNNGPQFRANVEVMHHRFGITEPHFIDTTRQ